MPSLLPPGSHSLGHHVHSFPSRLLSAFWTRVFSSGFLPGRWGLSSVSPSHGRPLCSVFLLRAHVTLTPRARAALPSSCSRLLFPELVQLPDLFAWLSVYQSWTNPSALQTLEKLLWSVSLPQVVPLTYLFPGPSAWTGCFRLRHTWSLSPLPHLLLFIWDWHSCFCGLSLHFGGTHL